MNALPHRVLMILSVSLLGFLMACSRKDPVDLLIKDLKEAAEARDADAFEKRLATGFTANDRTGRDEALAILRRYFAAYERITVDIANVKRTNRGNGLNFQVSFSGNVNAAFNLHNLLPSTAAYQFDLRLVQEDDTLKVRKAFWQQVSGF